MRSCRLFVYGVPQATFEILDECAGYFVSRAPVTPARVDIVDDPIAELANRGEELRMVPNLWPLRDAVAASSLNFSLIRMRNARPHAGSGR